MRHKIGMNSSEIKPNSGSKWAMDMQTHFARTGAYRPEDVKKVLGDPLKGVEFPTREPTDLLKSPKPKT
jgi:hypothetical protein